MKIAWRKARGAGMTQPLRAAGLVLSRQDHVLSPHGAHQGNSTVGPTLQGFLQLDAPTIGKQLKVEQVKWAEAERLAANPQS
jgi:hypothetical protein